MSKKKMRYMNTQDNSWIMLMSDDVARMIREDQLEGRKGMMGLGEKDDITSVIV